MLQDDRLLLHRLQEADQERVLRTGLDLLPRDGRLLPEWAGVLHIVRESQEACVLRGALHLLPRGRWGRLLPG